LIESILLGIPIPPIFVSQREDGIWDVVDGLQRLSTIYEFVGKLKGEDGEPLKPLTLEKTDYLPSLESKKWENPHDQETSLTQVQRLLIKRSKIDVTILQKEGDEIAKYELFQRLNTGGSTATPQEVRSCILVMFNRDMYHWMRELGRNEMFREYISLSDRPLEEQYDIELVLRFLVFRSLEEEELKQVGDLGIFLTKKMVSMAQRQGFPYETEKDAFEKTFEILYSQLGNDSFRKYDVRRDKFLGGFLVSAYEVIALGIGYNYENIAKSASALDLREKVKSIWMHTEYTSWSGSGITAQRRIPKIVPLGREVFKA